MALRSITVTIACHAAKPSTPRASHYVARVAEAARTGHSSMKAKPLRGVPGPPMVVRHRNIGRAQEREGVVHRVGEARNPADVGAFSDSLGADRMMRRRGRRPVGFPFRRL